MAHLALQRVRLTLVCCSIALNAIFGGGILTFPLLSPALVDRMKFTQSQLSTIVIAAMVTNNVCSPFVGGVLDQYGPRISSLLGSIILSVGYGLFAWRFSNTPADSIQSSIASFRLAVFSFALVGLGTTFSYFSLLFAATRTLPEYSGVATGTSLALFGLSPMILSVTASTFFTNSARLDVAQFLVFLAVSTGITNLLGALILPGPMKGNTPVLSVIACDVVSDDTVLTERNSTDSERQPFLSSSEIVAPQTVAVSEPEDITVMGVFKDSSFWMLALCGSLLIGAGDMVKTNIGFVVLSLSSSPESASRVISRQVELISIANTAARLLGGSLADFVSPVACYSPAGVWSFPRRRYLSRMSFLTLASALFLSVFLWAVFGLSDLNLLWPFSIGIGVVYGTVMTIVPGIVSSIWGLQNHARNYGILAYAVFVGFPIYSSLYAYVATSHSASHESVCHGVQCWRLTFALCGAGALVSMVVSLVLWRRLRAML